MHPELSKRFEDLEARRKALTDRVKSLPSEKQTMRLEKGSFSPVDVLMHLAVSEEFDAKFMRKVPPTALKGRKVKHGFAYKSTLQKMQNPEKRLATPPMLLPKGSYTLAQAEKAWGDVRMELRKFLEQVERPEDAMVKMMFFFGTLSGRDLLEFLEAHMHYHEVRFPAV